MPRPDAGDEKQVNGKGDRSRSDNQITHNAGQQAGLSQRTGRPARREGGACVCAREEPGHKGPVFLTAVE